MRRTRVTREDAMAWLDTRLGHEVHAWLSLQLDGGTGSPISIFGHLHHWREADPRPQLPSLELEDVEATYTVGHKFAIDFNDVPDAFVTGDMGEDGADDLLEVALAAGATLCIAEAPSQATEH